MVTDDQLRQIMPNLNAAKRAAYLPHLQSAMQEFGINTPLREAAFLAQLAHESGEFRWMEEIWGPTQAQRRYEPPSGLAARLGNTQRGDGFRFKGRGPIQLTGRSNYQRYGRELGVDLTGHPELAATSEVAFRVAGLYWSKNGLNDLADKQWFKTITKRINGGFNGLPDRVRYYQRAKQVLGAPRSVARGATAEETGADDDAPKKIARGLDDAGEMTPIAEERNAGAERRAAAAEEVVAESGKGTASKKTASSKKSGSKKNGDARRASKRALCVGINDYPYEGNDLNGCVNDAHAWADTLKNQFGFAGSDVKMLIDAEATKKNMLATFQELLAGAQRGDVLVFCNSSHGSYVADTSGDEETYDEIICPYDIDDNDIVDDELRELILNMKDGVHLTVILDNCFSGTATRAAVREILPGHRTPDDRRVRFLSPALRGLPILKNPWTAQPRRKEKYPESKMREVLLSGCTDREYSYDAFLGGVYHGAMTYYALEAIRQAGGKLSYAQLHQRLNSSIDYPQHPQLEGSVEGKKRQIFS